jgi:hypothetical protein
MKNNSSVYNLIGGIALLLYAIYAEYVLVKGFMGIDSSVFLDNILNFMPSLVSMLLLLVLGAAGIMLIVDFVRNKEESKQPVTATLIALACSIPFLIALIFWASLLLTDNITIGETGILPLIVDFLGKIVVIGLYVVNRKAVAEFVTSKIRVEPVKTPVIITILYCIGGGLLSAVIFYPMMTPPIYMAWADTLPFAILILAVVCVITSKIVGYKTGVIVNLCTLYLLAVLEYALIIGSEGQFFMADGMGWMILKVACAALVLFYQFLLVGNCFRYYNRNFGAFTASLLIGAAAILTAVFAILTAIYAIIIAIVAIVGYVVLKIATASSGSGSGSSGKGKKKIRVNYGDGSYEDMEEEGRGPTGETFYRNNETGNTYTD